MNGVDLLLLGRAAEAEASFDQARAFEAENSFGLWGGGVARTTLGRPHDGLALIERAMTPPHRGG